MLNPRQPQSRPLLTIQLLILCSIVLSLTVIAILIFALGWNALWVLTTPTLLFLLLGKVHALRNPRVR